jgi:hypothetical protein
MGSSKGQSASPYYLVVANGNINCHCNGNPLAIFFQKKKNWMYTKELIPRENVTYLFPLFCNLFSTFFTFFLNSGYKDF